MLPGPFRLTLALFALQVRLLSLPFLLLPRRDPRPGDPGEEQPADSEDCIRDHHFHDHYPPTTRGPGFAPDPPNILNC